MPHSLIKQIAIKGIFVFALWSFFLFSGCAQNSSGLVPTLSSQTNFESQADSLIKNDPGGTIPVPHSSESMHTEPQKKQENGSEALSYEVTIDSGNAPELVEPFLKASQLEQMKETPTYSLASIEQRLHVDLKVAKDVLHAFGYYAGEVSGNVHKNTSVNKNTDKSTPKASASVTISFTPGPQYLMGKTLVSCRFREETALSVPPKGLPTSLEDVGLKNGDPAITENVLSAVDKVHQSFHNSGYPKASILSTRYTVDHGTKTLDASIVITPGRLVHMGKIAPEGKVTVHKSYLKALQTWKNDQLWDQSLADSYRESLRQSGLFQAATVAPGKKDEAGVSSVVVQLSPLPERTVGADIKYDTDFGPGFQLRWEHRNITGNGDRLSVDMPIWQDLQQLAVRYRLPFFLNSPRQDFVANAAAIKEQTDAYDMSAAVGSFGIERRFTERFKASIMTAVEGGELKDPEKKKTSYYMYGFPLSLSYDTTTNLLDAYKGYRLTAKVSPHSGEYREPFSLFRSQLEGQFFVPLVHKDTLVFALRAATGTMTGASAQNVPPSVRFYSGGGGSVRGYSYQSLSPRNSDNDPLGGSSFEEVNMELRYKLTPEWGFVGFVDGGMAYEENVPKYFSNTRWGAGLGIRFYTAIGPIRLDVATPLNPRQDDDSFQIYFSIGQNF